MITAERHLRDRAESYWRDSQKLTGIEATAYKTIADELRKTADALRLLREGQSCS